MDYYEIYSSSYLIGYVIFGDNGVVYIMKPLGLSINIVSGLPSLKVEIPNRVQNLIWDAVEASIEKGITPKQFIAEVSECWEEALLRQVKDAKEDFNIQLKHMGQI